MYWNKEYYKSYIGDGTIIYIACYDTFQTTYVVTLN
jgi:hypothetical protein